MALPLLRVSGLAKAYPGVQAIRSATLQVCAGEIHALVGENGAGKSTLMRIVTGVNEPDAGTIELDGTPVRLSSPPYASSLGIAAIPQEMTLVPALTVRENLFLGREPSRVGFVDRAAERRATRELFRRLGVTMDSEARVRDLDVARQQLLLIARALAADARLLVMDEPTSALAPSEVERLFAVLADLRQRKAGILFVSHRLDEVFRIADRITVMRDGTTLGTWEASALTRGQLVEQMVGRPLGEEFPARAEGTGDAVMSVHALRGGRVAGVSFDVRRGEVLGIAGVVGAGRTELARLIFGADRKEAGEVHLEGRPVWIGSPRDAIRQGIGFLTDDRKEQGLVAGLSAQDNFALPNLGRWSRVGWILRRRVTAAFLRFVVSLRIQVAGPGQAAGTLSGGNQQKLLVARWLESGSRVLVFDEPTRGIDVGARREIYSLIRDLAAEGRGIVVISSDLQEILGMSDRILVMRGGTIVGEIRDVARASQEEVLSMAVA